jgi:adenosylcobinamide-GDP ribazoletransferase
MPMRDTATRLYADLLGAFGLLSRLPLPPSPLPARAQAAWAWPLVGLAIGAISAGFAIVALYLGLPPGLAALCYLVTAALATGALHHDGLADSFDGLFGGWTKERRLEIMKDSHIGSYGTLSLLLVVLGSWQSVTLLLDQAAYGSLLAAAMLSRAPMAVVMAALPNARGSGLASLVGRPTAIPVAIAMALSCFGLLMTPAPLRMALAAGFAALALALAAKARIGGQTGDILGGTQQVSELAALMAAVSAQ